MSVAKHHSATFPRLGLERFFASAASLPAFIGHQHPSGNRDVARSWIAPAFEKLGERLAQNRVELAAQRRITADGFNVFDFIDPSENVLSDILHFFLDPTASHGQGAMFLQSLIKRVRPDLTIDCTQASVVRESLTYSIRKHRRRIDLLVTLDDFVLAVENKKFTGEGRNQIHDYSTHLQNISAGRPFCLIFLSRMGAEASSITPSFARELKAHGRLTSWSWEKDVPSWLRTAHAQCGSAKIQHFLDDFGTYIRAYLATREDLSEDNESE